VRRARSHDRRWFNFDQVLGFVLKRRVIARGHHVVVRGDGFFKSVGIDAELFREFSSSESAFLSLMFKRSSMAEPEMRITFSW